MFFRKPLKIAVLMLALFSLSALAACGGGDEVETVEAGTELDEPFIPVISATGIVIPEEWASLSMPTGGVVDQIFVEEGGVVDEGEALLQLEGTEQLIAALEAAKLEEISAQQALDDLNENAGVAAAIAQQQVALARDLLHDAERDRSWLQEGNRASEDVIDESKAKLVLAKDAVDEAKTQYDKVSNRSSNDPIRANALANLSAARQRRDAALRAFNWYTGKPTEIDQAKLDADVAVAEAQLENATMEWDKVKDGPDPDALALATARLATAKAQREAAQAALDQLSLDAPFAGTVSELYPNENEWVAPGSPVALIADLNSLRVETTDLSEIDASQVKVGDRATVTFDALPDITSNGSVVFVSPKASEGAGVNFKVIVVLDEIPDSVRWGMTAFVDIEAEE